MSYSDKITALEYLQEEPTQTAAACVIWLHGLGADPADFSGLVEQLYLPRNHPIRFLFPYAPKRPITINGGMEMPGWYDILDLTLLGQEDETGILEATNQVRDLIDTQVSQGISPQRICLGGFSQGGAISLYAGLTYSQPLGGIISLSGYLPLAETCAKLAPSPSQRIFMAHGLFDPVVPFNLGQASYRYLEKLGYRPSWHSYPMQHTLCPQEIQDISQFLQQTLCDS